MRSWHKLDSSNLDSASYEKTGDAIGNVYIKFNARDENGNKRVYQYKGVPLSIFYTLTGNNLQDVGWFFNNFIKGNYECQEITID